MEIIQKQKVVILDTLKVGEVFKWDDNIYMKIEPCTISRDTSNVVNLEDGSHRYINTDSCVVPVKAKLIITYGEN